MVAFVKVVAFAEYYVSFDYYCIQIDSTFALQSCVYTQASLVPLPHSAPP